MAGLFNMGLKITAIRLQKRNPQRVNIYLDDQFAFGLQRIVAAWLVVGQEISEEKIAQLQAEDARESAYQRALNFMDYRPRSVGEVRKNLKNHNVPEETIDYVINRLLGNNLLNDAQFAQLWVENRSDMRPRSRRALAFELRSKGVAAEALAGALADIDDEELAYQAALTRSRRYEQLAWKDFRQKMARFLAQRGFDYNVISIALARVWEELHNSDEHGKEAIS